MDIIITVEKVIRDDVDYEGWVVYDNGDEFDDECYYEEDGQTFRDAEGDAESREAEYEDMGHSVRIVQV